MSSSTSSNSSRPMYDRMVKAFTEAFSPCKLQVIDESQSHAEHQAMRDYGFLETHFKVIIVSDHFKGKMPVQRHRMVYSLLDDELKNHGLHAVNIITRTVDEDQRQSSM